MEPTWQSDDGSVRLFLGDCRDVLPHLTGVNAVVTDPPYGIGFDYDGYEDSRANLKQLVDAVVPWGIGNAQRSVYLCGITQTHVYPEPDWIAAVTWNTTGSFGKCGYTQWMPVLFYGKDVPGFGNVEGVVTKNDHFQISGGDGVGFRRGEDIDHPCPKPVNLMRWAVNRFSLTGEVVADPFLGSGTTGVAAVQTGRRFVGIEQDERYFEVAKKRIQDALGMEVKAKDGTTQKRLFGVEVNGVMP